MVTLPGDYFDGLYADNPDPWGFTDRWYERRKYALTLAALPRRRYRSGFEPGCSIGVLSALLAERCDALLSVDVATAAVDAATERLRAHPHVTVRRLALPDEWPDGRFDLVLLSEVGYYFGHDDLDRLLARAVDSLEPGGDLVAVHWRRAVPEYPQPGDEVHRRLGHDFDVLHRTVRHEEADFLLDVFTRQPPAARSVAQREGIA